MIVKVNAYFREGAYSYYPGETFLDLDLIAQRGISAERIAHHIGLGHLEPTADADPEAVQVEETHLQAAMSAVGAEEVKTGLAEDAPSAAMPEGRAKPRTKE